MIATIRTDAPITFTLPPLHWKEGVAVEKMLTLFTELGFRTLKSRIQYLFDLKDETVADQTHSGISEEEVALASVMLWLIESDRTNASYDDIIDYGRSYFQTTDFKKIVEEFEVLLEKQNLTHLYTTIELPLRKVIVYMNALGIVLDTPYLESLSKTMHVELDALQKTIYTLAGTEFNINSPKQLGDVLFDTLGLGGSKIKKTATGQRSTK